MTASAALRTRGIASGFSYLGAEAGFGIGESLVPFTPSDSYGRAVLVGLLNTLRVSAAGLVAATAIGVAAGLLRRSRNPAWAALARCYVELFRNTPQLLQMIFWYAVMTRLPGPRAAIPLGGAGFLSNRGLALPWPAAHEAALSVLGAIAAGVALWALLRALRPGWRHAWLLVPALPLATWAAAGAPVAWESPVLRGLNFRGGVTLSPEFMALFLGLALYTGAFIAEIVRGGLDSVARGQIEAASALGLSPGRRNRLVVLPQALRVMIPPTAGQYVSLVKNSALAVAIGYPDLVSVSNTTLSQTGHVVEAIALMSAVYLAISVAIAAAMNLYNRAVAIRER